MNLSNLQKLIKKTDNFNVEPREIIKILTEKKIIRGLSASEFLLRSIVPIGSITIYSFLEINALNTLILIVMISISTLELAWKINRSRKLRKKIIKHWINNADHLKIGLMVSLLKKEGMLDEISVIAEYYLKAETAEQMQSFPAFWEEIIETDLVAKYYEKFFSKINLIPTNYHVSFQTSIVKYPIIYAFRNNDKNKLFTSPIIERCIFAEYYLKYYIISEEGETDKDRLLNYFNELELLVSLIDYEKDIFLQLCKDKHLDQDFKNVLTELYSITEKFPAYTVEYPTIYHLIIEKTTNPILKCIAVKEAIQNISRYNISLNTLPEAFNKVTKLCTNFSKNQIEDLLPWDILPVFWLHLLRKRQRFEFPQISRLYCRNCLIFSKVHEIIGYRGQVYNLTPKCDCSFCPECKETKNLEYVLGNVCGVISDRQFISKENQDFYIGIWDDVAKKPLTAEIEKLIFFPGLSIDYDWALVAILEQITGRENNKKSLIVEIQSSINLKENTRRILNDFMQDGRINLIEVNTLN